MKEIEELLEDIIENSKVATLRFPRNGIEAQKVLTIKAEILRRFAEKGTYIHQLRGALGYDVPGHIPENPEIKNGIADALYKQFKELDDIAQKAIDKGMECSLYLNQTTRQARLKQ